MDMDSVEQTRPQGISCAANAGGKTSGDEV